MEAQRAARAIETERVEVRVSSRSVAEEVLSYYPELVDTGDWGWSMIKGLLARSKLF